MLKVSILKIVVVLLTCISSLKLRGVFQKFSSSVCFAPEFVSLSSLFTAVLKFM